MREGEGKGGREGDGEGKEEGEWEGKGKLFPAASCKE